MQCARCGFSWGSAHLALCPRCALNSVIEAGVRAPDSEQIEGYERIHELGHGGMSVVWLARDVALDRLVALKLVRTRDDPTLAQRLLREGQVVARLRHPRIVTVHALGTAPQGVFLVMDFLEGGNLQDRLKQRLLSPVEAATLLSQAAAALAHAHREGVLHRDLKPSNILLDERGEPVLADFGLAVPISGSGELTLEGHLLGTPAFLAPELLKGASHASIQSDLYGLGAVLHACLSGRPPHTGDSPAALLASVAEGQRPPLNLLCPGIPGRLERIVERCLCREPGQPSLR